VSRTTLRVVIILAVISIAGITITQIYWVRKALDIRENQFNRDVSAALNTVAQSIFEINKTPVPASSPVKQISTNYFIVEANGPVNASVLEFLLVNEFKNRNITAGFEYGIYDCAEKCMKGGNYISPKNVKSVSLFPETPRLGGDGYYFAVQFPFLEANLISQMGIWGFSSGHFLFRLHPLCHPQTAPALGRAKGFYQQHDARIQDTDLNDRHCCERAA
jgi:two-component system phosphate regulon sensor histidine kinase PhoR